MVKTAPALLSSYAGGNGSSNGAPRPAPSPPAATQQQQGTLGFSSGGFSRRGKCDGKKHGSGDTGSSNSEGGYSAGNTGGQPNSGGSIASSASTPPGG
jgi:hypothetical protein